MLRPYPYRRRLQILAASASHPGVNHAPNRKRRMPELDRPISAAYSDCVRMKMDSRSNHESVRPRVSGCAKASMQAEIERVRRMRVEERVLAALGMKSKFVWLRPAPVRKQGHESS